MRHTSVFALAILLFATAPLAAQDAEPPTSGERSFTSSEALGERAPLPALEVREALSAVEERAAFGTTSLPSILDRTDLEVEIELQGTLELIEAEAPVETALVRQPDRRGWWWLVAAIVAGGVILAVIL